MILFLRFGLPLLWLLSCFSGLGSIVRTGVFLAAVAVWVWPLLRKAMGSGRSSAPQRPGADPLESSFETASSPDSSWTRFIVYPARGKGPTTSLMTLFAIVGGAAGGALVGHAVMGSQGDLWGIVFAGPFLAYFSNRLVHQHVLGPFHLSGYRKAVQAPNHFDVGPSGLRIANQVISRAALLRYTRFNPFSNVTCHAPVSSPFVVGTGMLGVAATTGASIGSSVIQASAIQRAHLLARLATHGWVLEVVDTRGDGHRLAGGLTENTVHALIHAIEQHLGA